MMKKGLLRLALQGVILITLAVGQLPALAGSAATGDCSQVDFYISNTIDATVFYDVTNVTIADVVLGNIAPGEEHRISVPSHSFPPGYYEFWVTDHREWEYGEWVYVPACSRVAMYIKLVRGQPVLKVKVIQPQAAE